MAIVTSQILAETDLVGTLINSQLTPTGLTAYVSFIDSKTGEARTPQSTTLEFTIDKDNERSETILCTSHSTSSGVTTLTIAANGRALPKFGTGDGSGTGLTHDVGAKVGCVNIARPINQLAAQAAAKNGDVFTGNITFSGTDFAGLVANSLTQAQIDALVGVEGMIVKNSTSGELNQYIGGSWIAVAAGSTQPNMSTTVAGKGERATDAELAAGTGTGGTGAPTVATGSSFTATPTANKVPVADGTGKLATGWITPQTITPAAAGEAVDGSSTPQLVYISDGANSRTAGRFYKADADDNTNIAIIPVGFVTENASSVGTTYDVKQGIVSGFTGLTAGAIYYSSTTAGAISATAAQYSYPIGRAISTTAILVFTPNLTPQAYTQIFTNVATASSANVDFYSGFKPRNISFVIYMLGGGSFAVDGQFAGNYNVVSNTWTGYWTQWKNSATPKVLVQTSFINTISDFTVDGQSSNPSRIAMTISVASTYTRFTFTTTTLGGTGSTCGYAIAATFHP